MVGTACPPYDFKVLAFRFSSPERRRVAQAGQEVSARTDETTSHSTKLANDASQVAGYVRVPQWGAGCAPRQVELRSPACLRLIEGTPQGRQTGVAFSLVTFFLAKQKKVTSCRATPGGVGFDCWVSLRSTQLTC
jgi:hypothetical protein